MRRVLLTPGLALPAYQEALPGQEYQEIADPRRGQGLPPVAGLVDDPAGPLPEVAACGLLLGAGAEVRLEPVAGHQAASSALPSSTGPSWSHSSRFTSSSVNSGCSPLTRWTFRLNIRQRSTSVSH